MQARAPPRAHRLCNNVVHRIDEMNVQDVSNSLWALAKLAHTTEAAEAASRALDARLAEVAANASTPDLAQLVGAYGATGRHPGGRTVAALEGRCHFYEGHSLLQDLC